MPFVNSLQDQGLVQKEDKTTWADSPLNKKAKEDFCFVINKSGLAYFSKLGHIVVTGSGSKTLAECIVVGTDKKNNQVAIPATELTDSEEFGRIAVVNYSDDAVEGIYLFSYAEIKKVGLFSRFKFSKKTNEYIIKASGIDKCADNKFGVVFSKYLTK